MTRTLTALAVLAVATVAACTSEPSNDLDLPAALPTTATTTTPVVVTTLGQTIPPAETTTTSTVTVAPPTTSPGAARTDPPTTTAAPLPVEDQVKADFLEGRAEYVRCLLSPPTCDATTFAVPGSSYALEQQERFDQWAANNLRVVDGRGQILTRVDSIEVAQATAYATVCTYDTLIVYDVANLDDPSDDVVLDDDKVSHVVRWEMRRAGDNEWLVVRGTTEDVSEVSDICGF